LTANLSNGLASPDIPNWKLENHLHSTRISTPVLSTFTIKTWWRLQRSLCAYQRNKRVPENKLAPFFFLLLPQNTTLNAYARAESAVGLPGSGALPGADVI
jgi:hypothetical protein